METIKKGKFLKRYWYESPETMLILGVLGGVAFTVIAFAMAMELISILLIICGVAILLGISHCFGRKPLFTGTYQIESGYPLFGEGENSRYIYITVIPQKSNVENQRFCIYIFLNDGSIKKSNETTLASTGKIYSVFTMKKEDNVEKIIFIDKKNKRAEEITLKSS